MLPCALTSTKKWPKNDQKKSKKHTLKIPRLTEKKCARAPLGETAKITRKKKGKEEKHSGRELKKVAN